MIFILPQGTRRGSLGIGSASTRLSRKDRILGSDLRFMRYKWQPGSHSLHTYHGGLKSGDGEALRGFMVAGLTEYSFAPMRLLTVIPSS